MMVGEPCGGFDTQGTITLLDNVHCVSQEHTMAHRQSNLNLSLSPSPLGLKQKKKQRKERKREGGMGKGESGQALFYCSFIPLHSVTQMQ